jgi:MFS family permease
MLGVVPFAAMLPAFLVTPFAGVMADNFDKRKLLIMANSLAAIQALTLAILSFAGIIQPWHIILLGMVMGVANGFEMTSRHSFIPEIVEKKQDLVNAISLNSALFNLARLVGPSVPGLILAVTSEGVCFLINAISYTAIIISVSLIQTKSKKISGPARARDVFRELSDGLKYVFKNVPMSITIVLMAFVSLAVNSCFVLLPVIAKQTLHGGPQMLGLLMSSFGAGALCGALFMAMQKDARHLGFTILTGVVMMGVFNLSASFSKSVIPLCIMFFGSGIGNMLHMASSNTLLQTLSPDEKRGRVMSFYVMSFTGFGMAGNLLAGWLAKVASVQITFACYGIAGIFSAIIFLLALPTVNKSLKNAHLKLTVDTQPKEA